MERDKINPSTTFGNVLREMHALTGNVETSFTSKMITTLHPDRLIWDSLVLARLGLKLRRATAQAKLENAVEVYREIISRYKTYLASDGAEKNMRLFDELLPGDAWLTSRRCNLVYRRGGGNALPPLFVRSNSTPEKNIRIF